MTLKLLVDAHVGGPLYSRLETDFDVVRVVDVLDPDASDVEVWRYAVDHDLIIFSNDADFVSGQANPNDGTHPGIIRYTGRDWKRIHSAVKYIDNTYTHEHIADNALKIHVPGNWA